MSSRFDQEAAQWDSNPTTVKSSDAFCKCLEERIEGFRRGRHSGQNGLEIGCGTGLLSVQLAPFLSQYYAFDPSGGMLQVLQSKLASLPPSCKLHPIKELLTDANTPSLHGNKVHFVFSHLTLHHIPEDSLQPTYQVLYDVLEEGGQIFLSDFEYSNESELFHPKANHHDVERHGIKRSDVRKGLEGAGFVDVTVEHSFDLPKGCEDGTTRTFPFIIVSSNQVGRSIAAETRFRQADANQSEAACSFAAYVDGIPLQSVEPTQDVTLANGRDRSMYDRLVSYIILICNGRPGETSPCDEEVEAMLRQTAE